MKKILSIFINDVRKISTNIIAIIIVGGLLILPSLYAWINIYACWDPYGSTDGIMIAVSNQDEGGQLNDVEFNIGESLIEELQENTALGWIFIDDIDEAIELTEVGDAYATIVIPEDFSKKMSTIITTNPMKPSLEYYINEKVNAIAPKITGAGASTLQNQISSTFVETVTTEIFEILNEAGVKTQDEITPTIDIYREYLDDLIETIPTVQDRLENNSKMVESGSEMATLAADDIELINNLSHDLITFTSDLQEDLDNLNEDSEEISRNITETLSTTKIALQDFDKNVVKLQEQVVLQRPNVVNRLDTSAANIRKLIVDTRELQKRLQEYDEQITPEIQELAKQTETNLIHLEELLGKAADVDYYTEITETTKAIRELNNEIRENVSDLDSTTDGEETALDTRSEKVDTISKSLDDLFTELDGKTEITEKGSQISADMSPTITELKSDLSEADPLYLTLTDIETNLESLKDKEQFDDSLSNLKRDQQALERYNEGYSDFEDVASESNGVTASILATVDTVDEICDSIDENAESFSEATEYYLSTMESDTRDIRKNLTTVYTITAEEKNYLVPQIREITNTSLNTMEDVADLLDIVSEKVENGNVEDDLEYIHDLNLKTIANLENLIVKINTDLTSTVQKYLSSGSDFTADANVLLVSISDKSELIEEITRSIGSNGQVAAEDMVKLSEALPGLQESLKELSKKMEDSSARTKIKNFLENVMPNEEVLTDYVAYPVDLNNHYLYTTEFYGTSMTPFYTALAIWVGVLILGSVLTTESKNADFEPTPLQTYLGKYPLFLGMAILQSLIIALGDIYLLKVDVFQPGLFIWLSIYLAFVFCTTVYVLLALFGNVGKAIGVVLLVLQVAGSGGTFPIQMTPKFFQMLYEWLPFTYGIGALREAIFGVYYPALRKDIIILALYPIIFFAIGFTFVSVNHGPLEKITEKFEESGIGE